MWLCFVLIFLFGCSNILSSAIDLGGVLSGNRMAGIPLGISMGEGELDFEGICSESGFACENCTHAVTCVPLPVGYLKVPLQACPKHQTCNAQLGKCSDEHVPECQIDTQLYEHTCEQVATDVMDSIIQTTLCKERRKKKIRLFYETMLLPIGTSNHLLTLLPRYFEVGIFPDAHDCRKFHLCSPPDGSLSGRPADHRAALCPRHYGYNPLTAQCSIPLKKGQCTSKLVPECKTVGQFGALQLSSNHYYVCLIRNEKLYPQIFLCPHGWFFVDGFCRPNKGDAKENHVEEKANGTNIEDISKTEDTIIERTTSRIESFFSTERTSTYAPDTFLAHKFDMSKYDWNVNNPEAMGNSNSYESYSGEN